MLTALLLSVLVIWTLGSLLPPKPRQFVLLLGSYVFYAGLAGPSFLAILAASSVFNFGCAEEIRRTNSRAWLWVGVAANIAILGFFKYAPLLAGFESNIAGFNLLRNVLMPLGVSFWTFQGLSYLFDAYREEEATPTLLEFCLYMAFWPTVVSGPVMRVADMLPQLREKFAFNADDLIAGLRLIVKGVVLKFLLAELLNSGLNAGEGVTAGFDVAPEQWGGLDVWLLAIGFGFQLFFDFAGYTAIVIGVSRIFGFRLVENFNRPYLSTTPAIFWTRWHMSLSSWIRDYVFMPLAAMRRERWWLYSSVVVSMVLFGLWHDAKWTFVFWGLYQGMLLVIHRIGQQVKRSRNINVAPLLGHTLSWCATFLFVTLGWVFFRANDIQQAIAMLGSVVSPNTYAHFNLPAMFYLLTPLIVLSYFAFSLLEVRFARQPAVQFTELLNARAAWWLTPVVLALLFVVAVVVIGGNVSSTHFIYTVF